MAKGTKSKVKEMEQTDGRHDSPAMRTIDEILGNHKRRYRQGNLEEYQTYLKGLNLTDMHVHAQTVGLVPVSDRRVMETRLIREFKKTSSRYFGTAVQSEPNMVLSDKAKQILSSGR